MQGHIKKNKGKGKGSAITGPVAKERADLWPGLVSNAGSIPWFSSIFVKKKKKNIEMYLPSHKRRFELFIKICKQLILHLTDLNLKFTHTHTHTPLIKGFPSDF